MEIDRERMLEIEEIKIKGKNILDFGVGSPGRIAVEKFNCVVITVNIDEKLVEKVKEEHADLIEMEKMKIEKADATALTYGDNSFDISVRGFPHSPDEYTVVDMEWLKKELKKMGKTEKFSDDKIFLYAINKF